MIINGSSNFDYLQGTAESDSIIAFGGNDIVYGQKGDDAIGGGEGKDKLNGGQGNDTIYGGVDNDMIWGAKGNDRIFGEAGNDTLIGGKGSDTLTGSEGNDIFGIAIEGCGCQTITKADYITDFTSGSDTLRLLNGVKYEDLNIFQGTGINSNDTVIRDKITGEYLAVLQGVNANTITKNNFVTFTSGKIITDWNSTLLDAVRSAGTPPPLASRNMAMVHAAIYDAVNAIDKSYSVYKAQVQAPAGASEAAAAAAAANQVLTSLYPAQKAKFDAALASSLAAIPNNQAKTDGIAVGVSAADRIIALRSKDGASTTVTYTPTNNPGDWVPTPPDFANALLPQWPKIDCFAMVNGEQFRPSGPPALDSAKYAEEVNFVKEIGAKDSLMRSADQTAIAKFWADGANTFTPPGHWNQIAAQSSVLAENSLAENARLFALLNIGLADAGICAWDAKYEYDLWRPVTAIQQADKDGNPATIVDANWQPLLTTPPFPEYTSGHSTFSGAADSILSYFFGDDFCFVDGGDPSLNSSLRKFDSFGNAADEAGMSRLYGGIHFMSANQDGLKAGRDLGNYVVQNFLV
ncbi:chemotaxis protein CheB [Oscillatoriales cyanobacterium USR001]|nr:chemotaxis protein CheB [Oscillatoriales cyanobacterium USR001]